MSTLNRIGGIDQLSELLGSEPIVRIMGHGELEPTAAWYGSYEPFGRQFPTVEFSLDRHVYETLHRELRSRNGPRSERARGPSPLESIQDVIVDGEQLAVVFMDIFGHTENTVAEYEHVAFVADTVVEMSAEEENIIL